MYKYKVVFDNTIIEMSEQNLLQFVKQAVIINKDIAEFKVTRIDR